MVDGSRNDGPTSPGDMTFVEPWGSCGVMESRERAKRMGRCVWCRWLKAVAAVLLPVAWLMD
jgi:hypothetical protein